MSKKKPVDNHKPIKPTDVEIEMIALITCCACGEEEEFPCNNDIEAASNLTKDGWRVVDSAKLETEDVMCPACVKLDDEDRGEE